MRRRLVRTILLVLLLAAVAAGGGLLWFKRAIVRPGPLAADKVVLVPPGSGVARIAVLLTEAGVTRSALMFRLAGRYSGLDRHLKAGEFRFPARASLMGVLDVLRLGEPVAHMLTVPEGLTVPEVLALVDKSVGLQGPLPAPPEEGSLLPETYRYAYYDSKAGLVRRLQQAMDAALDKAWAARDQAVALTSPEEALTLASIVEKETALPAERPRVAAVFLNRLKKGMKLQSDPTVVYGLTEGKGPLGRPLTHADLEKATPWNTYVISGLPPTPIANPGLASIRAVLHPAKTEDLYFVADGTGGHAFSETLAEHNRNVAKWRKLHNGTK